MRPGFTRVWLAGVLLAAVPAGTRAADVVQAPQRNVTAETLPQGAAPAPGMPDERPLWRLLSTGEDAALQQRIARLRSAYPDWQPPPRLLALLDRRGDEIALTEAKTRRDWAGVRRLAVAHPDLASCTRPDEAAIVAAAPGAPSSLAAIYASCTNDAARAALLGAVLDRFGLAAAAPVLGGREDNQVPPAIQARLAAARTDQAFQRLGRALAEGSPDSLVQGAALRAAIEARQDGATASALGWAALKAGNPRGALTWFELGRSLDPAQPAAGLARAYTALGEADAARAALAAAPGPESAALSAEIDRALIDQDYRRGAYQEVVARAASLADPPILLGWSLFRLARFNDAAAAFERRYRAHRERAAAEGLLASLMKAGRPAAAESAAARLGGAVRVAWQADGRIRGDDAGLLALQPLRAALARHDDAAAATLGAGLEASMVARQEYGLLTALGWAAFARDDFTAAAHWFALGAGAPTPAGRDNADYGAVLTRYRQGDAAGAEAAAAAHAQEGRWGKLRLDALMLRANLLNEASPDDPAAAEAARTALRLDPDRRDAAMLLAWGDVRAGRSAEAAAIFERLYRAQPDAAAASGLVNAPAAPETLQALIAAQGGPLIAAVQRRSAQDAFGRKAFLAAARIDPGLSPALVNIDAAQFGLSTTYRDKSGGSGTSRLSSLAQDVTASLVDGVDRYTIRLHVLELNAGSAVPAPAGAVARMTTRLTGVEPVASWERQAMALPLLSPFAEIGLTPLNGVVGPTVQGLAGVGLQAGPGNVRGVAYRQSVTESILSFTGVTDPRSGRRIGRVTETGARIEGYVQLAPRWGVYGQTSLGLRDGVGVRSNLHAASAASLSYDLHPAALDYLTVGPSYQYSAFQRDLSGFTPGQGGYYSPAWSHTLGGVVRLQTKEAADAMLRAAVFTGYQLARSDGAATGGGRRAAPSRQDGFNATGEVLAAYRLSERWVAGGMVRFQVSPQYTDLYAGLALTYSLGDRAKLLSADLPRFDVR